MRDSATDWPVYIEETALWNSESGSGRAVLKSLSFTPESWTAAVAGLLAIRGRSAFRDCCLICRRVISSQNSRSREHVITQGVGIRWVDLPAGVVCDLCNNGCSKAELAFQRGGLFSVLRPFYLRRKSEIVFADAAGGSLTLRNDPLGSGFTIEARALSKIALPSASGGSGYLTLTVPSRSTSAISASRALHKMAYLMLTVLEPEFAFSPLFDRVRRFISDPPGVPFMPFDESFVSSAPGCQLRYALVGQQDGDTTAFRDVIASVQLHHCKYGFSMCGDYPPTLALGRYFAAPTGGGTPEPLEIVFRLDSANRVGNQ